MIPLSDMIEDDEETLKLLEVKIQPISSDGSHGRFYSVPLVPDSLAKDQHHPNYISIFMHYIWLE